MPDYEVKPYRNSLAVYWLDPDRPPGKRRRRDALGTNDRSLAETRARAFWRALHAPQHSTVGQIVDAYIDDRKMEIASSARQLYAWKALKSDFANILPEHIDRGHCLLYAERRCAAGLSSATYHYELSLIRQALRWAEHNKIIDRAPHIWLPAKPPPRNKYLTKAQFSKFLKGCVAPHVRLFAILAVSTGARPGAILELAWGRVDFKRGLIDLNPVGRIQNAKNRPTVPINRRAKTALKIALKVATTDYVVEWAGGPVGTMKKGFLRASARSKVHCTPYMLRHSAAIWMAEEGRAMSEIAQYMGHSDSRTTERHYARYSPDYLRGAAKALEW